MSTTGPGSLSHVIRDAWTLHYTLLLALFLASLGACSSDQAELPYKDGQRLVQALNQGWKFNLSEPESEAERAG